MISCLIWLHSCPQMGQYIKIVLLFNLIVKDESVFCYYTIISKCFKKLPQEDEFLLKIMG